MLRKSSRYISKKLLVSCLLTFITSTPGALQADDYTQMIQYELQFGNKRPVSNLYMSMRPAGVETAMQFGSGTQPVFRTPVFSTDPHRMTLLRPLSVLFAVEESDTSTDVDSDESAPDKTVGEHVRTVVGGALFAGIFIFAPLIAASNDSGNFDPCEDGCDIDLDIPEVPPEAAS